MLNTCTDYCLIHMGTISIILWIYFWIFLALKKNIKIAHIEAYTPLLSHATLSFLSQSETQSVCVPPGEPSEQGSPIKPGSFQRKGNIKVFAVLIYS